MKKQLLSLSVLLLVILLLSGCAKTYPNPSDKVFPKDLSPYLTLPDLAEIEIRKVDASVTDEQVEAQVMTLRSRYSTLKASGEGAKKGDYVILDYYGSVDGQNDSAFSEEESEGVIGYGIYLSAMEEAILGQKEGSVVRATAVLPDPFLQEPSYSGKTVNFLIRIREVDTQTMEEYTDEWVAAHTDYKTIASFEKAVREKLESDKAVSVNNYYREKAWQALKEKTVFADVQSEILDSYLQESAEYYSLLAEYRGMTLEEVRSEMGYPGEEEFQEYLETSARDRIRDQMLLLSLTRMYGITLSESELNAGKEALVSNLGLNSVESLEGLYDEDTIVETVLMVKAQSELLNHITFLP